MNELRAVAEIVDLTQEATVTETSQSAIADSMNLHRGELRQLVEGNVQNTLASHRRDHGTGGKHRPVLAASTEQLREEIRETGQSVLVHGSLH
jgi:hypothetical protein